MSNFQIPKMGILKSNGLFCNFYPTLHKTFFILKMSKRAPFRYLKWKLSSQMDSGAFAKIITLEIKTKQNKTKQKKKNSETPSYEKLAMMSQFDLTQLF